MYNFTQALMEAKRRAQVSGRPLTRNETSGIAEGYASVASERLARSKALANQGRGLDLQEKSITNQSDQHASTLAQNQAQFEANQEMQKDAQEDAAKAAMVETGVNAATTAGTIWYLGGKLAPAAAETAATVGATGTTTAAGTTAAGAEAGAVGAEGAGVGALGTAGMAAGYYGLAKAGGYMMREVFPEDSHLGQVGESLDRPLNVEQYWAKELDLAGRLGVEDHQVQTVLDVLNPLSAAERYVSDAVGTWICTATKETIGMTPDEWDELARFRQYARENHFNVLRHYIEIGPNLISAIRESEGDNLTAFYENLMVDMIRPVIVLSGSSHSEQAFEMYRDHTVKLCEKYTPELLGEFIKVVETDIEFMEAV